MGKITFIIGGARSGKSGLALRLAEEKGGKTAFIATAQALDKEMQKRIALHQKSRPGHWQTLEEPLRVSRLVKKIAHDFEVIIIDCLTLLISNLLLARRKEASIAAEVRRIHSLLKKAKGETIIVSNEVGLGIIPENDLHREFRDIAGRVNQIMAVKFDRVYFMFAGIPLKLK